MDTQKSWLERLQKANSRGQLLNANMSVPKWQVASGKRPMTNGKW